MSAKAFVFLAEGFEEVEALTPVDFLRRAGVEVRTVAVGSGDSKQITAGHGVTVVADMLMKDLHLLDGEYDALVLPGGMPGASNLAADKDLLSLLKKGHAGGAHICAICAAPAVVLGAGGAGLLEGKKFTCYPGFEKQAGQGEHVHDRVMVDGKLITSIGAGSAAEFAVEVIRQLAGDEAADRVHRSTLQK